MLLKQALPDAPQAEACFHQALDIARGQQGRFWELHAATRQGRLWQQQGKHQAAYDLLAPVYKWFTEDHQRLALFYPELDSSIMVQGFDTAALIDAKAVLDELS